MTNELNEELEMDQEIPDPEEELEQIEIVDESEYQAKKDAEEDEKEQYSKRVQKRIDKLAYERNIERTKREELERRLEEQARIIEEIKSSQQEHLEKVNGDTLEAQKRELLQRRRDYLEIGDYDEVNRIDEELIDIKIKSKEPKQVQQNRPEQSQQPAQPVPQQYTPEAMQRWIDANPWVTDPKQKMRLDKTDNIYQELVSKGYDPEDDELYHEIDKRMKRDVPPPMPGPDRGKAQGGDKSTAFTQADKKAMEDWGLDPNNPQHRKEWIKNKG